MSRQPVGGLWSALAWFVFPLVPTWLGGVYYQTCNLAIFQKNGPDPHDWGWFQWVFLAGPLLGYGFLAGATIELPDDPGRRGPRSWLSRRSVWVGVGPWVGFVAWGAAMAAAGWLDAVLPERAVLSRPQSWSLEGTWAGAALGWVINVATVGALAYGWVLVALAALRRARRMGRVRRALERGAAVAFAFVGSLFGSFWAITEAWRSYFFDSRIAPLVLSAVGLALLPACASPVSYGEIRRRELFSAMLTAWLLGLALAWRWWSRPRHGPPDS